MKVLLTLRYSYKQLGPQSDFYVYAALQISEFYEVIPSSLPLQPLSKHHPPACTAAPLSASFCIGDFTISEPPWVVPTSLDIQGYVSAYKLKTLKFLMALSHYIT